MFVASNSHCAKSVIQVRTNSYNLDDLKKDSFYISCHKSQIQEIVLASAVINIFYTALVINISVTELSYKRLYYNRSKTVRYGTMEIYGI